MTDFTLVRSGRTVRLGERLGGGGEATIFACPDQPDLVAKVYATLPDRDKVTKLAAMAGAAGEPMLARVAAWPVDLLADPRHAVHGFVMPRVTARRNVHELYGPKSRAQVFPRADFRFLVRVGANIARAFAVVHACGLVVGDVNHGNLLVSPDGKVTLIDCDSFQFSAGRRVYTCDVGTDLFTPPELHGRSLKGIERTPNHDAFGLAVLIFHLLFMGRHPFAGRYLGPGEMPIERAIAEYRFAYGANRAASQMERPPWTLPLETMGPVVAEYFERAFSRAGSRGGRPDARAWVPALASLEQNLKPCAVQGRHHYPPHLATCPWCSVEQATGVRLFGVAPLAPAGAVNVADLWAAIAAMPGPDPDPLLPSELHPLPARRRTRRSRTAGRVRHLAAARLPVPLPRLSAEQVKSLRVIASVVLLIVGVALMIALHSAWGVVLMVALLALSVLALPWKTRRAAAQEACAQAKAEWRAALKQWRAEASVERYAQLRHDLEEARDELLDLPQAQQQGGAAPAGNRELRQKRRYLDRFRIDVADIPRIGENRKAMLASFGVETADDVREERILTIPGFGAALTAELLAWRKRHEANFRYNPDAPVDPQRRAELVDLLKNGPETLRQAREEIEQARSRLMPGLEQVWEAYVAARATQDGR